MTIRRDALVVGWLALVGCQAKPEDAPAEAAPSASAAAANPPGSSSAMSSSDPEPPTKALAKVEHLFVGSTSEHACFTTTDHALHCWGRNDTGQLGRKDDEPFSARRVPVGAPVVGAALGERHTCALLDSGKVRCLGEDASGPRAIGEDVAGVEGATQIVAGADFTCAVLRDHAVACFGRVPGDAGVSRDATRIVGVEAKALAASSRAMCALLVSGGISCIGDNGDGAYVKGGPRRLDGPTTVPELEGPIESIAMADDGVCALGARRRVTCHGVGSAWEGASMWSTSAFSYSADGYGCSIADDYITCRSPTSTSRLYADVRGAFREVGVGRGFACAVPSGPGPVVCWGDNARGALGVSPPRPRATPFEITSMAGASRIEAGDASVCALIGKQIRCFGDHDRKEEYGSHKLGDDTASQIVRVDDIAVGGGIRCGMTDGLASCWGDNRANGIISENPGRVEAPTTLASLGKLKRLSFGATHACAIGEGDVIRCWGGIGRARKAPKVVTGFGDVHQLEVGGARVCALLKDGGASCATLEGEHALEPQRVAGVRGLVAIAVGGRHVCGLDARGVVSCFGDHDQGQLGRTDAGPTEVVEIEGLPKSRALSAGDAFTCALGEDEKVRCWGASGEGQLGRPDGPLAEVEGLASVKGIAAGERHACALREGGKVLCWGDRRLSRFIMKETAFSKDPMPIPIDHTPVP